ncbi:MAG TPA: lasso peptide biosynthesis B2 protein [Longimicrobiaceae bacterium]|nr:lasso peptide biosynthesis B2 protein [Longimicrobiaceae bacterium]
MLRPLRSYARLPAAERRLALRAVALVVAFRIALWTLPASRVLAAAPRPRARPAHAGIAPERIARLVRAGARRIPAASCLTRALAARWLLAEAAQPSTLHFGHRRDHRGRFAAHAWLEHGGQVLIGGDEDLALYHRFAPAPGAVERAPPAAAAPDHAPAHRT